MNGLGILKNIVEKFLWIMWEIGKNAQENRPKTVDKPVCNVDIYIKFTMVNFISFIFW